MSRRPVLTLHLPLEMGDVGRVLELASKLWPGATVRETAADGAVVVEAEAAGLAEQPRPGNAQLLDVRERPTEPVEPTGAEAWIVPSWAEPPKLGERVSSCRSCQAPVLWVVTKRTGRRAPINADGTSHFATCPQADEWRKK